MRLQNNRTSKAREVGTDLHVDTVEFFDKHVGVHVVRFIKLADLQPHGGRKRAGRKG